MSGSSCKLQLLVFTLATLAQASVAHAVIPLLYDVPDDAIGRAARSNSIAVTPDGRPSIAYAGNGGLLKYTEYIHPNWVTETIPTSGLGVFDISLTLDSQGNPAVAVSQLVASGGPLVRVFERSEGVWTSVFISPDFGQNYSSSLKYDTLGNLHLAYAHLPIFGAYARYASNRTGSWVVEDLLPGGVPPRQPDRSYVSLALDPGNKPSVAVSYYNYVSENTKLEYWRWVGSWTTSTVLVTSGIVDEISLAVGAGSIPHIVFSHDGLRYAKGPIWNVELLQARDTFDFSATSIALDSNDEPHIAYRDPAPQSIRYKFRSSGVWVTEAIETLDDVGREASIAIDGYDHPHFSYVHLDDEELRYAASRDCNDNGLTDNLDIQIGNLLDCDGNGLPDLCEWVFGFLEDCNGNGIPDACDVDCNGNGIPDECDISSGTSTDCNLDGIPDECPGAVDCNDNGVPDECDISAGTSVDCNLDGIPDECPSAADCDGNGTPDTCESFVDCNNNGIPDACDVAAGGDCDSNGIPDACDIAAGTLEDCDGSLVPDLCEELPSGSDCNANGILDACDLTEHLLVEGLDPVGEFGHAFASGQDFDGDGHPDLMVGAASENGHFGPGRVYMFAGGSGIDGSPDLTFSGQGSGDEFGISLDYVGDFNGDGDVDLVVGAPLNDSGPQNSGRAYVYFGGPGADTNADVILNGEFGGSVGEQLGWAVAGAGDVNGDGIHDIIVSAPERNQPARVFLYYGSDGISPGSSLVPDESYGNLGGAYEYGAALAGAGDINGDGFADVLIGSYDDAGGRAGQVEVMVGGASGLTLLTTLPSQSSGDQFGFSVAFVGDHDQDGLDDILVGAPFSSAGGLGFEAGAAYLFHTGGSMDTAPDLVFLPPSSPFGIQGRLGLSVSGGEDLNDDGFADLLIGQSSIRNGAQVGRAYVFLGHPSGDVELDRIIVGEFDGDELGRGTALTGDLDGDGHQDFVVGSPSANAVGRFQLIDVRPQTFSDCNENGVGDACDIESGFSLDLNTNQVPDECEATAVHPSDVPRRLELTRVAPNPFNPRTTLHLEAPRPGNVEVLIFDARGRQVRSLAVEVPRTDSYDVEWDGRDDSGHVLASGVYFASVRGQGEATGPPVKLILLK